MTGRRAWSKKPGRANWINWYGRRGRPYRPCFDKLARSYKGARMRYQGCPWCPARDEVAGMKASEP